MYKMEEIIMNTIIAAVITASATLIGIFIIEAIYGKRIFSKLEKHDETDGSAHVKLSNEHLELKLNTKSIFQLSQKIESKVENMDKAMSTEKETKRLQFENLSDKQKEMKLSLDKLVGFADELEKVNMYNAKLTRELNELQMENNEIRIQNRKLREKIRKMDRDDEYDISR